MAKGIPMRRFRPVLWGDRDMAASGAERLGRPVVFVGRMEGEDRGYERVGWTPAGLEGAEAPGPDPWLMSQEGSQEEFHGFRNGRPSCPIDTCRPEAYHILPTPAPAGSEWRNLFRSSSTGRASGC